MPNCQRVERSSHEETLEASGFEGQDGRNPNAIDSAEELIYEHVLDEPDSPTQMNTNAIDFLGLRPSKVMAGDDIIKKGSCKKLSRVIFPLWLSKLDSINKSKPKSCNETST